jgi:hypothetical protein
MGALVTSTTVLVSRRIIGSTIIRRLTKQLRCALLLGCVLWAPLAVAQELSGPRVKDDAHLVYVPLPRGVSKGALVSPAEALKTHLWRSAGHDPGVHARLVQAKADVDLVVTFVDLDGQPILPDLRAAASRKPGGTPAAPIKGKNELTFTFDSPAFPWTDDELRTLRAALTDLYPTAKAVYGTPAFNITVNVRKDPEIASAGFYSPSVNEIVLPGASALDGLCHEMLHAFRDDDIVALGSYEEGMVRAAEIEVFNRLATYAHWDTHHSYTYDVYYEGLNRQKIGAEGGNLFAGYVSPLLRYQLASYAWAKLLLENPHFLADFNKNLYKRILSDPSTRSTESKLLGVAAAVQPTVEGAPLLTWYGQQGVFNTHPPEGGFLYQRVNQFATDCFIRDGSGQEFMQANMPITWAVYGDDDSLLYTDSAVTSDYGWAEVHPTLPEGYTGRIKVVVSAAAPSGTISDTALRYHGSETGVFGVVAGATAGTVTVAALDTPAPPVTATVVNGGFSLPSLATPKGRFLATFTDPSGHGISKQFNKDASDYFLLLHWAPPNDACEDASVIAAVPFTDTLDTSMATVAADDPMQPCTHSQNANSVWYSITPANSGNVTVDTLGSRYDTVVTVYTGQCGALRPVACNADPGGRAQATFTATAGTTYALEVTQRGALSGGGSLHLNVQPRQLRRSAF